MSTDRPHLTAASARLEREFERIVRNESHAHGLRTGTLVCMSSAAWECGFSQDRRVIMTADALRALIPCRDAADPVSLTEMLDRRAEQVLTAASGRARSGSLEFLAEFDVVFPGDGSPTGFTVAVEAFGSPTAVVVVGWQGSDVDVTPLAL